MKISVDTRLIRTTITVMIEKIINENTLRINDWSISYDYATDDHKQTVDKLTEATLAENTRLQKLIDMLDKSNTVDLHKLKQYCQKLMFGSSVVWCDAINYDYKLPVIGFIEGLIRTGVNKLENCNE